MKHSEAGQRLLLSLRFSASGDITSFERLPSVWRRQAFEPCPRSLPALLLPVRAIFLPEKTALDADAGVRDRFRFSPCSSPAARSDLGEVFPGWEVRFRSTALRCV